MQVLAIVSTCAGFATACGFGPKRLPRLPPPGLVIAVNPAVLQFQPAPVGSAAASLAVEVTTASGDVPQIRLRLESDSAFRAAMECDRRLQPAHCVVTVFFEPRAVGPVEDALEILDMSGSHDVRLVQLRGSGVASTPPR